MKNDKCKICGGQLCRIPKNKQRATNKCQKCFLSSSEWGVFLSKSMKEWHRNNIHPMLNKTHTSNSRKKISEAGKGRVVSEKTRKKRSCSLKKYLKTHVHPALGKKHSRETKEKISRALKNKPRLNTRNENHHNWKGGISKEPYSFGFDNPLKEKIRKRDAYRCQECFRHQDELSRKLCIHHIDYNKKNNSENNLISLCSICHTQTNFKRYEWSEYYNQRLAERGGYNG